MGTHAATRTGCAGANPTRLARSSTAAAGRSSMSASTRSERCLAVLAPRCSATRAYTNAAANAISRPYRAICSSSQSSSPLFAIRTATGSTASSASRINSTVCPRVTACAAAAGTDPRPVFEVPSGSSGLLSHNKNRARPASTTSDTQPCASSDNASNQSSSRSRSIDAARSSSWRFSTRRIVAARGDRGVVMAALQI